MAIGTTDTFTQTRDQIISDALANVGAIGPGEDAAGAMRDHAARALGRVTKALDAKGVFLWRVIRRTFTTVSGTAAYTPASDVLDIDEPFSYLRSGQTGRSHIRLMSRDEYTMLSDRTTAGVPSQCMVEKVLASTGQEQATVTFWPVPDASGDTIEYSAYLRGKDYNAGSTHGDFPTKWIKCLTAGLSAELAPAYGQLPLAGYYQNVFAAELETQLTDNNERGNLILVPFGGSSY